MTLDDWIRAAREPLPSSAPLCQSAPTAWSEQAVYFRSGVERLFGILTASADTARASRGTLGVLLAHSGVNNFSAHRNGVWATIARRLAGDGITSLRFDFTGTGESSGRHIYSLAGQALSDVTAAIAALRDRGCDRLLLVGSCFGGIPTTVAAANRHDVVGVVLLSPPMVMSATRQRLRERVGGLANRAILTALVTNGEFRRWYLARVHALAVAQLRLTRSAAVARPDRRATASAELARQAAAEPRIDGLLVGAELRTILASGATLDVVFGSQDSNLAAVESDRNTLAAVRGLRNSGPSFGWHVFPGAVHGLEDAAVQQAVITFIVETARRHA